MSLFSSSTRYIHADLDKGIEFARLMRCMMFMGPEI